MGKSNKKMKNISYFVSILNYNLDQDSIVEGS